MIEIDLRDEVRNGFYIPTAIKQAWSAQMKVLGAIEEICQKHDIDYFADWGTLLATVRHGGYIPWDDDVDICMKRSDYERFRAVADEELPEGFAIHDYERQEDHWLFIAKVVNTNHINYSEEHLKEYNNFPYIACVDIFLIDNLYDDEDKESERSEEIKHLLAIADGIVEGRIVGDSKESLLSETEKNYGIKIARNLSNRELGIRLYALVEAQMSRVKDSESNHIAQIFPWILKGGKGFDKSDYGHSMLLPYEGGYMRVPYCYENVLSRKYSNYMQVKKMWTGHAYPFYEGQLKSLKEVADFEIPEYKFSSDMLLPYKKDSEEGKLMPIFRECIEQMNVMMQILKDEGNPEILPEIQQLAIDLGNLIDELIGEGSEIVDILSSFCEHLFYLYQDISDAEKMKAVEDTLKSLESISNKELVVFITANNAMDKLYEEEKQKGNIIIQINAHRYNKDIYGNLTGNDEAIINIEAIHPDRIYIDYQYDEQNPVESLHPDYYASKLRKHTRELIFVQPFKVDDFENDSWPDVHNMKYLATMPGVIYADKVLVSSEKMKDRFVDSLVEFAGDEYTEELRSKITAEDIFDNGLHKVENKKKLLYVIGENELHECPDYEERNAARFKIFDEYADKIEVVTKYYPQDKDELYDLAEECSAYYGSPTPIVMRFRDMKKPVMISSKTIEY